MSNDINIESVSPLDPNDSKYVKPMRMHYTQNGKSRSWECIKTHDSVAIILFNVSRCKLIFVKQFRPAVLLAASLKEPGSQTLQRAQISGFTLELCAGILDKAGKSAAETAQEEVLEETGYMVDVKSLKFLSSFRSGVGTSGSLQYLYFCEVRDEQKVSKGGGVEDENIEVIELGLDDARNKIYVRDEECPESRPAAMLFALSWFFSEYYNVEKLNS